MTRVDFYTGSTDKLRTACQLCHKAMQHGLHAIVSLPDAECDALDRLMWQYPDTAFIPHARIDAQDAAQMPVLLCSEEGKFPYHDMLISLHDACQPYFSRFERVIEIVGTGDEESRLGRERYKFYRDRGYEMRHVDLAKANPS